MTVPSTLATRAQAHPNLSLLTFFIGWKAWLLLVAYLSPGPAYDTSTSLLLAQSQDLPNLTRSPAPTPDSFGLLEKLTRWDAIYFMRVARRGYLFEQEWAFGWGFTKLVGVLAQPLARWGLEQTAEMVAGVLLAHTSHLLSVLALYQLTLTVFPSKRPRSSSNLALVAAALHIISPAGIFLSAPYAESPFSLLSFSSQLLYAQTVANRVNGSKPHGTTWDHTKVVLAGFLAGLATLLRSNGLLGGLPFLGDAVLTGAAFLRNPKSAGLPALRHLAALVVGGSFIAAGIVLPQWIAYDEICRQSLTTRPWCHRWIPSIYSWNQDHYWNVGFLRYWTLSNLPLFLLASPMLVIMSLSAVWAIRDSLNHSTNRMVSNDKPEKPGALGQTKRVSDRITPARNITSQCLWRFALAQLVLTISAIFVYHVQIITRISSGYAVWYWWLASAIVSGDLSDKETAPRWPSYVVRWMVIYGTVQGGLFASFLPPA
ncbi:MAG: 60S ribosomal protein L8B [Chaenotheca gracillima]|nr:MAG: 60S ribosomal protein L8B [Chaenotheca gracillima]